MQLLDDLLSSENNQVALISFSGASQIVSEFTNDKEDLTAKINSLTTGEEKDCIVLFLTDGYPSKDVPNEVVEYAYLKEKYPYLEIHTVQYEIGDTIDD